jgi:hypothetical protein
MPDIEAAENALAGLPTLPPMGETDTFDRSTPPPSVVA